MSKDKSLFLLEDNQDLTDRIVRLANRNHWHVFPARSLQCAIELAKQEKGNFSTALIDLMVPASFDEVTLVDGWLKERGILGTALQNFGVTGVTATPQVERGAVLQEMDNIDQRIRDKILDQGGIEFLRSDIGQQCIVESDVRIAIFSARPADETEGGISLSDIVDKLLGERRLDRWFEKPVSLLDLNSWLFDAHDGTNDKSNREDRA